MTDLELPTLQIGRYVELLKRRRWQLLPAALLGLVVGFLVAWFIPRFYEAKTLVRLYPRLFSGELGGGKDPFLQETAKARLTIANYELVRDAILDLAWEDFHAFPRDTQPFREKVWEVIGRLFVQDLDSGEGRSSALLEIAYRDQDPIRAATLANSIRDLYLARERKKLVDRSRGDVVLAENDLKKKLASWENVLAERARFISTAPINPNASDLFGRQIVSEHRRELISINTEIAELEPAILALEAEIEMRQTNLPPPDRDRDIDDPMVTLRFGTLQKELASLELILASWTPANRNYTVIKAMRDLKNAEFEAALEEARRTGFMTEPNPAYLAAIRTIEDKEAEAERSRIRLDGRKKRAKELIGLLSAVPEVNRNLDLLNERVNAARTALTEARARSAAKEEIYFSLDDSNMSQIIETISYAAPPPAPTYPNVWLVAMLGAGIGLGVAIGLIFLLDVLQPSYKTVDEVAQGLGLPVLGGVSFLVLPEDLALARRRRTVAAVCVALFFLLVASILVVYWNDPVRLPAWLQRALDSILSPGGG